MAVIHIEGIPPWDGDYPYDVSFFSNRELHEIKEWTGVRAGELQEEFDRGNNDLIVAVALIASKRLGKPIPPDDLWEAPAGRITMIGDEGDASPPEPGNNGSSAAGNETSGAPSNSTGDHLATPPSPTGDPGSETAAVFPPDETPSAR